MLISNTWADGKFGALFSAAYTNRRLVDEGSSTVRWGTPSANGNFAGLAPGYSGTATLAQLNAAFVPRIPRYDYYKHEQDRLGLTGALQWAPNERFSVNLDLAYAEFNAQRDEIFLEAPNFSAAANGMRVQNAVIDANNTLVYGVFNNVDIRSEHRHDELSTEFKQATLDGAFDITDKLRASALVGYSEANHDNPVQTTLLFDWLGFPQLTYDYRDDSRLPQLTYTGARRGFRPRRACAHPRGAPTDLCVQWLVPVAGPPAAADHGKHLQERPPAARLHAQRHPDVQGRWRIQGIRIRDYRAAPFERHQRQPGGHHSGRGGRGSCLHVLRSLHAGQGLSPCPPIRPPRSCCRTWTARMRYSTSTTLRSGPWARSRR